MKKTIYIALLLASFATLFASCSNEERTSGTEEGVPVTIRFETEGTGADSRAPYDNEALDKRISSFQVFVYDSKTKVLAFHETIDPAGLQPAEIDMRTGTYDFVFIANHSALDAQLAAAAVKGAGTKSQLEALSFPVSAFATDKDIPMVKAFNSVLVRSEGRVKAPGMSDYADVWPVGMERLGVRVDLSLEMANLFAAGAALSFTNVPDRVWLFRRDNTANVSTRTITSPSPSSSTTGDNTTLSWSRIILPEVWFTPVGTASKGVEVALTNSGDTRKVRIGLNPTTDYTMPRNHYFYLTGTVYEHEAEIDVTSSVVDWSEAALGNTELF